MEYLVDSFCQPSVWWTEFSNFYGCVGICLLVVVIVVVVGGGVVQTLKMDNETGSMTFSILV